MLFAQDEFGGSIFVTPKEINTVTKELQEKGKSLAHCGIALHILIGAVTEGKNVRHAHLHGCQLGTKYIKANASIIENAVFEN